MNLLRTFFFLALLPALLVAQTRGMKTEQQGNNLEKRIALVIGNGAYRTIPSLKNPANDAKAMSAKLTSLGFTVIIRVNANKKQMRDAIQQFGIAVRGSGVGLFYYAGHGVQSSGRNYLIPVNAEIASEGDVEDEAVSVDQILSRMGDAGNRMNIVILDACRNNPFSTFRSVSRGLTQMVAPSGTFIAYATAPGSVADDGDGTNGIYTQALLKELAVPGLQLEDMFKNVLSDVKKQTGNKQVPWTSSSVEGRFYFNRSFAEGVVPAALRDREFNISDLDTVARKEEDAKVAWSIMLARMTAAYSAVLSYEKRDVSSDLKAIAWSRLIQSYPNDIPYSSADDSMRSKGKERFTYWNRLRSSTSSLTPVDFPTAGLVTYYPFNENANDASGNGFNGIVRGATLVADRFGNPNSAYGFNGSSDYIDCGRILDSVFCAPVATFSISGWACSRTMGSSKIGSGFIIGINAGGSLGPYQWNVTHCDGLVVAGVFGDTAARNFITLINPMGLSTWFHVVLVFDGSLPELQRVKLYVDGQSSHVTPDRHVGTLGTTTALSQQHVTIGANHRANNPGSPGNFFDGTIDDIRIYNRALSVPEIQALYHENGYELAPPSVLTLFSFLPARNALHVAPDSPLSATFSDNINASTLTNKTVNIRGSLSGLHPSVFSFYAGTRTVRIAPSVPFRAGELVTVTLTNGIKSAAGDQLPRSYCWSYSVKTNAGAGRLQLRSSIQTGSNSSPHSVAALDVDGNGALDLAVANYGLGTVAILRNNGAGAFTQISSVIVGSNPNCVVSADVTNDGSPDIVTTNNGAGSLSILKNDGSGNFTARSVAVGDHPISVAAADLNGDGSIDLAVANNFGNSISLLRNDGSGSFTTYSTISVGAYPTAVAAADLNNDGFIDLAVTNSQSNSVSILLNNGDGTFTVNPSVGVGSIPWHVIAADLDGDGSLDLAVTNNRSGTVTLLRNDGTGHFTVSSILSPGGTPSFVTPVDINGDGSLDLVIGNNTLNTISVWINNGTGVFTGGSVVNVDSYPLLTIAADLNGDGGIELATANGVGNTISIISSRPAGAAIANGSIEGLVAYYPFNGNANDASGNGFNGVVHGATLVADRFGNPNSAYSFNGWNNYIDLGDILDSVFCAPVAKFSISGWANTRSPGSQQAGGGCIVTKSGGGDAGPYQWSVTHYIGNVVYAAVFCEPTGKQQILEKSNGPAPLNQWFHFVYIFDGGLPESNRVRIYVNGSRSEEQTVMRQGVIGTTTTNTAAHVCVGSSLNLPASPGNFYNGSVDNIRIYNRVLNGSEIQALLADTQ